MGLAGAREWDLGILEELRVLLLPHEVVVLVRPHRRSLQSIRSYELDFASVERLVVRSEVEPPTRKTYKLKLEIELEALIVGRNVVSCVAIPEHPTVCRLQLRFGNYSHFRTTAQKSVIPLGQNGTTTPVVPVLTEARTVTVKIIVNRRNEILSRNQLHCLVNIFYFLGIYRLFTFEGFTGSKSGPEQTCILSGFTLWGTRAMRRQQFYSANGFVSGNLTTSNFYPHNVALTTYFRLMVSSPKTRQKDSYQSLMSSSEDSISRPIKDPGNSKGIEDSVNSKYKATETELEALIVGRNVVSCVSIPEHPTVCRLQLRFGNYSHFRTTAQKSVIPLGQNGTTTPVVPVLTEARTVTVKIIVNRRNELLSRNQLHCLVNIFYFLGIYRLFTFEGFTGSKSGPEQTCILYPHNVALTTYFRLMVSSPKTRQKDSFISLKCSRQKFVICAMHRNHMKTTQHTVSFPVVEEAC
ncbi:hypothetical protein LXL04_006596 [Taraxacum kok-saghyz]